MSAGTTSHSQVKPVGVLAAPACIPHSPRKFQIEANLAGPECQYCKYGTAPGKSAYKLEGQRRVLRGNPEALLKPLRNQH